MFLAVENMSIIVVIIDDCPIFKKCSKTFAGVNFSCELSRPIYSVLSHLQLIVYFIHLFTVLRRFQHCTGHINTYSWSRFCTVNCRPTASNYQLSHLRSGWEWNPKFRGGRRECYHSATMAPLIIKTHKTYL